MTRQEVGTTAPERAGPMRDAEVLAMVEDAVARKAVALAFQPVMQAAAPDQVAFYEGLVRLFDAQGRVIPARAFIDRVETLDIGRRIDCLSLDRGLSALRYHPGLRLAINMSARSMDDPRWHQTLDEGVAKDPTIGERLILEITEASAMGRPSAVTAFMRDLQYRGIAFAMDDFGAGMTSFRYLRQFYFDVVKIDGQFIRGISENADNRVLVSALVMIARHFDMFTVAEAVETPEDAACCIEMGITCLQGYHFGAPTLQPGWAESGRLTA